LFCFKVAVARNVMVTRFHRPDAAKVLPGSQWLGSTQLTGSLLPGWSGLRYFGNE